MLHAMSRQRVRFHSVQAGAALLLTVSAVGSGFGAQAGAQQRAAVAQPQALAPTPPMGWSSWEHFGCEVTEDVIKRAADAVVASGMADAGYEYINVDDCWAAPERDPQTGRLRAHPQRFGSGIAALADYVHARGLKLGIYSSAGTASCQDSMPGSLDHEVIDARTFAEWGVDRLKYDNCNNLGRPAPQRYAAMGAALREVDRPIVYSINEWGTNEPWTWAEQAGGHTWVTAASRSAGWNSVLTRLDAQVGLERYSHPNAWNDPGSLAVGSGTLTWREDRANFALWALLNAPLTTGTDVTTMDDRTKRILTNRELIAVNQDWGGTQGYRVRSAGGSEVWAKPMSDGSVAVVLLNRTDTPARIQTSTDEIGVAEADRYRVRDLWSSTEKPSAGTITAEVAPHGAAVYRVWPRWPSRGHSYPDSGGGR